MRRSSRALGAKGKRCAGMLGGRGLDSAEVRFGCRVLSTCRRSVIEEGHGLRGNRRAARRVIGASAVVAWAGHGVIPWTALGVDSATAAMVSARTGTCATIYAHS